MNALSYYVFSPLSYFFNNSSDEYYNNININKDFEILGDELDSFDILNEITYKEDKKDVKKQLIIILSNNLKKIGRIN